MMKLEDLKYGDEVMYNGMLVRVYGLMGPLPSEDPHFNDKPTVTIWCNGLLTVLLEDLYKHNIEN